MAELGFIIPTFAPPTLPPVAAPPAGGPPVVELIGVGLWIAQMLLGNQEGSAPVGPFQRKKEKLCDDCCRDAIRFGNKAIRALAPSLDSLSPKTADAVKRFRRVKVTRDPAW